MKDIMLDIEGFGQCINQIAARVFDIKTKELGEAFCINIDPISSQQLGYDYDDTFWNAQDPEVYRRVTENPVDVLTGLQAFKDFTDKHKACKIWSHSLYDFNMIQQYLGRLNIRRISYRRSRDITTLVALSGISLKKYDKTLKTHDASDDVIYQVNYVSDAYNKLKGNKLDK